MLPTNLASFDCDILISSAELVRPVYVIVNYEKKKDTKHTLVENQHPHELTLIVCHKLHADSKVT